MDGNRRCNDVSRVSDNRSNKDVLIFSDAWTQHMAHTMARMAESGRAKIKEVCIFTRFLVQFYITGFNGCLNQTSICGDQVLWSSDLRTHF